MNNLFQLIKKFCAAFMVAALMLAALPVKPAYAAACSSVAGAVSAYPAAVYGEGCLLHCETA